ncbi:cellulase [Labilibacter sediminis]|nr:cellulase [Labilibacter sediminis]
MMKKNNIYYSLFFVFATTMLWSCCSSKPKEYVVSEDILINQVAYPVQGNKYALLRLDASDFSLNDADGNIVFKGKTGPWKKWDLSGDSTRIADFSKFSTAGEYSIVVNDTLCSYPVVISERPYDSVGKAALKAFYYNRSNMEIEEKYGKEWSRKGGHSDTVVYIHKSAASASRPEGSVISSSGGWYDAGDYNKYIVNSGITTYTLMLSYFLNPEYHHNLNVSIPESENDIPDILDEVLCNLNWMLTMQDFKDGGVYHKLTTKNFDGFIMPDQVTAKRYMVGKSTSAALDFAATMAFASRIFKDVNGQQKIASQFKERAQLAWEWAKLNPNNYFLNPSDITTGEYKDTSLVDEWFWAASELYLTTGNADYKEVLVRNKEKVNTPKWDVVNTLGFISLITSDKAEEFVSLQEEYLDFVNLLLLQDQQSAYSVSVGEMAWGSNSDVANQGVLKQVGYNLTQDEKYQRSAQNDLDYLLGRNATAYCFVTGFGNKTPMNIHHRPSGADGVDKPVPGFLVGGPNIIVLNDCGDEVQRSLFPAKSYIDMQCSFSTNEIAINWNAPLVLLASSINAHVN